MKRWHILVVTGLMLALALTVIGREYVSETGRYRATLEAQGRTILDALGAGIHSQTRMGLYRADRLTAIFDALAGAPNVAGIELRKETGERIALAGRPVDGKLYPGVWQEPDILIMSEVFDVEVTPPPPPPPNAEPGNPAQPFRQWPPYGGPGPGPGRGRGGMRMNWYREDPQRREWRPEGNMDNTGPLPPFPTPPPPGMRPPPYGGRERWRDDGRGFDGRPPMENRPPMDGRFQGNGPPDWPPPEEEALWFEWGTPRFVLTVSLDTAEVGAQTRRAAFRYGVAALLTVTAFVLAGAVLGTLSRQRQLHAKLELAQERIEHHERLARLGAGLAHETKNPLGIVRGLAQSIGDSEGVPEPVRKQIRQIVDEVDRAVGEINAFLSFAKPAEAVLAPVALSRCFAGLEELMRQEAVAHGVHLGFNAGNLAIEADEILLRRALLNLVLNAMTACPRGGRISVEAGLAADGVRIAVADTGAGIAPEDLARVKEPYFSRFPKGTGLGLAVVDEIVRTHGWRWDIVSTLGAGTTVILAGIRRVESNA